MSVLLYSFDGSLQCIDVDNATIGVGECLKKFVSRNCEGAAEEELFLTQNGRLVHNDQKVNLVPGDVLRVCMRLPGGKGGFGSMLRAMGAQIEKTTNREACRDLSGRRMRDVNDEKKIAEWVNKQAEREREAAQKKQEKLERLKQGPAHTFDDSTYTKQIQGNAEMIHSALQQGLRAASATTVPGPSSEQKRKVEEMHYAGAKKKRLWLGFDDLDSDEDDEESHIEVPKSSLDTSTTSTCTTTKDNNMPSSSTTVQRNDQEDNPTTAGEPSSSSTEIHSKTSPDDSGTVKVESAENTPHSNQKPSGSTDGIATVSVQQEAKPICLADYNSAEELEVLGLDCLKSELLSRGLKCGGTLQQRAQRLFTAKNVPLNQLDPSFFAKVPNGKKNGKK